MDKDERLRITVVTKRLNTTPTSYVVDVVVLCGCRLQRVKKRSGEGCLRVVELGELHNLKVGIVTSSEDRRKVGGCLKSAVCVREGGVGVHRAFCAGDWCHKINTLETTQFRRKQCAGVGRSTVGGWRWYADPRNGQGLQAQSYPGSCRDHGVLTDGLRKYLFNPGDPVPLKS